IVFKLYFNFNKYERIIKKRRVYMLIHNKSEIENLPQEMLVHIFSFFNKRDLAKAGEVCSAFHQVSTDEQLQQQAVYPSLDYTQPLPEKLREIQCHGIVFCMTELSDNEIVNSCDETLRIWNIKTGECI